jgi:hypothetical protein
VHRLSRASMLVVVAVILFASLWFVFGQMGTETFPRLVLSLCLTPAAISMSIGIYLLVVRR